MCGIVAISASGAGDAALATRMGQALDAMPWRGPDGSGSIQGCDAAVGMCRLRVRSAPQDPVPFEGPRGEVYAFNGEVYGVGTYMGRQPVAGGLSEARCAADNWREVDGMWAVARLGRDGGIELRRDPWGIKPLWLRESSTEVVACSEVPALMAASSGVLPRVRPEAIVQLLLAGAVVDGGSYWEEVHPLPPGSGVRLHRGRATPLSADPGPVSTGPVTTPSIRGALRSAVQSALQSDRPVGVAVSGGLDSTIVALHVQEVGLEEVASVSVTPVGTRDGVSDLTALGLPPGAHQRWRHHHVTVGPSAFMDGLRRVTEHTGVPWALTSGPLYLALADAAHDAGVVVLLVGEGADELFGGYRSYLRLQEHTTPLDFYLDAHRAALVGALVGVEAQQLATAALTSRLRGSGTGPEAVLRQERTLSLGPLLDRTDATMMSRSIEARTPFLHGDVPDVASRLSWPELVDRGQTKVALRAAYAETLPAFRHETKVPFRAPWATWLRGSLQQEVRTLLRDGEPALEQLGLQPAAVHQVLEAAVRGDDVAANLCFTLCSLVHWAAWSDDRSRVASDRRA